MKRTPRLISAGFGLGIAFGLIQLASSLLFTDDPGVGVGGGWLLAVSGVTMGVAMTAMLGWFELVGRLSGRAAVGARLVVVALCGQVLSELGWIAVGYVALARPEDFTFGVLRTMQCASWGFGLLLALGVALAVEHWLLGLLCVLTAAMTTPPWFFSHLLWGWHEWSFRAHQVIQFAPHVVFYAVLLAGSAETSRSTIVVTDAAPVEPGLRRAGYALWLRAVAAAVAAVGAGLAAPSLPATPQGLLAATAVDAIALAWLASGLVRALRGSVGELPKAPLAVAIALILAQAGVDVAQLPWRYAAISESHADPAVLAGYANGLGIVGDLVAAGAIACVLAALATLAMRRKMSPLRARARLATLGFCVLAIAALAIPRLVADVPPLAPVAVGILALALAGWLCRATAHELDSPAADAPVTRGQ